MNNEQAVNGIVMSVMLMHTQAVAACTKAVWPMLCDKPQMVQLIAEHFAGSSATLSKLCEDVINSPSPDDFKSEIERDLHFGILIGEAVIADLQSTLALLRAHPLAPKSGVLSESEINRMMLEARDSIIAGSEGVQEASTLGFKPGVWPREFETRLGNGQPFVLYAEAGIEGERRYVQRNGELRLTVLND